MEGFQDIDHFIKSLYAAIKKKIPTKVSQLTNDAGYKTTDTNTTYKLSKSGSTVTLTGSDGSTTSVTDSNTTYSSLKNPYSLDIQINGVTVVSYDGSTPETVNAGNATASYSGLMSASDKSKLDSIDPSAITTNAANIKKNADSISAEVTRAKKAEEANTQLTNDLKTGLTSGTVRVAKATVADSASSLGKVSTYQTWIPDNGGRRKYLLMYDITDWISAKSNAPTRGFDGYFISGRSGGFVSNNCTGTLSMVASYNGMSGSTPIKSDDSQSLRLRTTSEMYKPVILHNTSTNKYYLALETYGGVRDLVLFGIFQGTFVGKWVQNVGQSFTPGTLPDGYELYSEGYVSIPDAATVNGHTVESNVPANAQFTDTTYPVFAGATASENGTTGLVPEPTIEDADKYLCGDGTWKTVSGGASDEPVEIPITKTTNVIRGTIVVYRIGHLLQIYANGLLIKRSTGYPDVHVCSIHNVDVDADGFTLGSNIAIWTTFDLADNPPIVYGPGLVLAQPNGPDAFDVLLIGVSGSSQDGVYFSLTVPLLDKKEEKE